MLTEHEGNNMQEESQMQYTTWGSLNDLDSVLICSKEIMNWLMNTSIRKHIFIINLENIPSYKG